MSTSTSKVDAPLLNSWISRASGARALLQLHSEHGSSMDAMHFGNLWNKLGRFARHLTPANATEVSQLADATHAHVAACSRADVLANIAHGAAQVSCLGGTSVPSLFNSVADAAPRAIHRCEPRHLANIAWSFASASQPHAALFDLLAGAATPLRLARFNGQELGMIAWAFAKVEHQGVTLSIAEVAGVRAAELEPQTLSTIAMSLVKLGAASMPSSARTTTERCLQCSAATDALEPRRGQARATGARAWASRP